MKHTRLGIAMLSLGVLAGASCYGVGVAHRLARLNSLAGEERLLREDLSVQTDVGAGSASSVAASDSDSRAAIVQRLTRDLDGLNVRGRSLTTGPVAADGTVGSMQIRLTFTSSSAAVFNLLRTFASYERQVWIEELVVARPPGAEPDALSVRIHLTTAAPTQEAP